MQIYAVTDSEKIHQKLEIVMMLQKPKELEVWNRRENTNTFHVGQVMIGAKMKRYIKYDVDT